MDLPDNYIIVGDKYAYLFTESDGSFFNGEATTNGSEILWDGDLGYASDTWVDGRYVDSYEVFAQGEKFADHPTSSIILTDFTIPLIKYNVESEYDSDSGQYVPKYEITDITEVEKTVKFWYDSTEKIWKPEKNYIFEGYGDLIFIREMVDLGVLDEKYWDMVTITPDEAKVMNLDRNTNTPITDFYYYDGSYEPGTKSNG